MKIICLVENTASRDGMGAEHGLSLYIEGAGKKILFDMGQTDLFMRNAEKLKVDLSQVDIAVLSHGHYDHGGGLAAFLEVNSKAPVYMSRYAFLPYYNGREKYIGLDTSLSSNGSIVFTDGEVDISDGITLYPFSAVTLRRPVLSGGLNKKVDGAFVPDDFLHEQYMMIRENGKSVLVSGCSHRGIYNIVTSFTPDVLIGGFHFSKLPLDGTLVKYAEELAGQNTDYYTCHCTGEGQFEFMRAHMGRLHYLSGGDVLLL